MLNTSSPHSSSGVCGRSAVGASQCRLGSASHASSRSDLMRRGARVFVSLCSMTEIGECAGASIGWHGVGGHDAC